MDTHSGEGFQEVRGRAEDLNDWRLLITGDVPAFGRVDNLGGGAFEGKYASRMIDRIQANVAEITADRHVVRRTRKHIRATEEALYVVMFQLAGNSVFTQAGNEARLAPGDFTVSTSAVPFSWEFDGDFTVFMLRFPQTLIDAPPQSLLPMLGQRIGHETGLGRHVSPFIAGIARDFNLLRGPAGRRLAQNLVDLLTSNLLAEAEEAQRSAGMSSSQFQQLAAYITDHLNDAALDAASVAAAHFFSTRSIQASFQAHGTTVSSWIRERRLAGARRDLADPVRADMTIAEIAESWGILDQAYFSRIFRRAFGESPKQWRVRARRSDAGPDRDPSRGGA